MNKPIKHNAEDHGQTQSSFLGSELQDTLRDKERSLSEEEGSHEEVSDYDTETEYGTPIRSRIRFTSEQTRMLEDIYQKNKRPSSETKQKMATKFATTMHRIQIWFQNRRAKEKKHTQDGDTPASDGFADGNAIASTSKESSRRHHNLSNENNKNDSRKGKRRRVSEDFEPRYPVQLRSDSSTQQRTSLIPPTYPFYHGTKSHNPAESGPSDYHQVISGIPTGRRTSQSFSYPPTFGKVFYHMTSQTMNPQDMVYRHSATDGATSNEFLQEPFTPPEEEVRVGHPADYFMNDDTLVGDMSSSRQPDGTPQPTNILAHDDDQGQQPTEKGVAGPKKDRKGKSRAT